MKKRNVKTTLVKKYTNKKVPEKFNTTSMFSEKFNANVISYIEDKIRETF